MKKVLKIIGGLLLVLVLGAGLWIANVGWYKPYSIDLFFNRVFVRFLFQNPELVTSLVPHPLFRSPAGRWFGRHPTSAGGIRAQ